MRYDWLAIAGETLNGRHVLTTFEDEVGGVGRYAADGHTIDILPVAAADSREVAARWQFLRSIAHPNVLSVVDTGTADLAGVDVVYCISERPEDTVASVLPERSLTPEETGQIVDSVLPALGHLRSQGAAYSRLSASEIVAVGEQVKLALDPIEPLGDRVAREWSREDVERVLKGQVVTGVAAKPAAPSVPPVPVPLPPAVPVDRPATRPQPAPPEPPAVPVTLSTVRKVALAAAVLVAVVLLYQLFRTRDPEPVPVADATRSSPVAPVPSPEAKRPVASAPAATRVGGWTVVVGAYAREQDALKRAASLNGKWSRGPIQVIRSRGRYLLVAASGLQSKAQADRIRQEARSAGLSRSSYVTKL